MTIDKQIEVANRHDKRERERLGNQCDGGEFSESERDAQIEEILVRRLKHKTVNKHLDVLGSIFKWLNTADIDADVRNPFKGRRFTKKELELLRQDTREAWDTATARRYLEGPAMSGCLSKSKRGEQGDEIIKDGLYWITLMLAFMCVRLEECAQAWRTDIVLVDGIHCLRIKSGGGKRTKNNQSERLAPIHPILLDLGLEAYLARPEIAAQRFLFPELHNIKKRRRPETQKEAWEVSLGGITKRKKLRRKGAAISKLTARYRQSLGVTDGWIDNHSFRATINTMLKGKGIAAETRDALLGHKGKSTAQIHYDKKEFVPILFTAIKCIDYGLVIKNINGENQIVRTPA